MRISAPAWALVLATLAHSGTARSQDIPYSNYLVGDRALGLGGAFVAVADDASATFHNPGGIALVPESAITASFWVAGIEHRRLGRGWRSPEGQSDLSDTSLTFPPLVVTAVSQLGQPNAHGWYRHAIGGAIIKPLRHRYRYTAITDDGASQLSSIDVARSDDARWYGGSYAYRPMTSLSFGVSVFVALRDLDHEEFEVHDRDGPLPEDLPLSRHSVFHATLRDLVWRFGAVWSPSSCWRVGAMFQLPGIGVGRSVDNRELVIDLDPAGTPITTSTRHDDVRAFREIPWEARLGLSWLRGDRMLVTADLAIHGAAGSARAPIALVRVPDMPPPRLLAMESYRGLSYRAAVGGEYVYRDRFPLRGGVLLYTSGKPSIPATAERPYDDDMITLGVSASAGMRLPENRRVSIGAALVHATGTASALDQSALGPSSYVAAGTSDTTILFFVSGGVSGAKELAKELVERGEEWIDQQDPPTE